MVLMTMGMLMMIPILPVMMVMTMVMKIHSGWWSPRQNLAAEKPLLFSGRVPPHSGGGR